MQQLAEGLKMLRLNNLIHVSVVMSELLGFGLHGAN